MIGKITQKRSKDNFIKFTIIPAMKRETESKAAWLQENQANKWIAALVLCLVMKYIIWGQIFTQKIIETILETFFNS